MRLLIKRLLLLCLAAGTLRPDFVSDYIPSDFPVFLQLYIPARDHKAFASYRARIDRRMKRYRQQKRTKQRDQIAHLGRCAFEVKHPTHHAGLEAFLEGEPSASSENRLDDFYYTLGLYEEFLRRKSSKKSIFWYRFGNYAKNIGYTIAHWFDAGSPSHSLI